MDELLPDFWRIISQWLDATDLFMLLCSGSKKLAYTLERCDFSHLYWRARNHFSAKSFKYTFQALNADRVTIAADYAFNWGIPSSCAKSATCAARNAILFETFVSVNQELLNWWHDHFESRKTSNPITEFQVSIPEFPGIQRPCTPFLPPALEILNLTMKKSHFDVAILPRTLQSLTLQLHCATIARFNAICSQILAELPVLTSCQFQAQAVREGKSRSASSPFSLQLPPTLHSFSLISPHVSKSTNSVTITGSETLKSLEISFMNAVPLRLANMPNLHTLITSTNLQSLKALIEGDAHGEHKALPKLSKLIISNVCLNAAPIHWPSTLTHLVILNFEITGSSSRPDIVRFSYASLPASLKHLEIRGSFDGVHQMHIGEDGEPEPPLMDGEMFEFRLAAAADEEDDGDALDSSSSEDDDDDNEAAASFNMRDLSHDEPSSLVVDSEDSLDGMIPHRSSMDASSPRSSTGPFARLAKDTTSAMQLYRKAQNEAWTRLSASVLDFTFSPESCGHAILPCHDSLETFILIGSLATVMTEAIDFLPKNLKHFEATIGHSHRKSSHDDATLCNAIIPVHTLETLLARFSHVQTLKIGHTAALLRSLPTSSSLIDFNLATCNMFIDSLKKNHRFDITQKLSSGAWQLPQWRLADRLPSNITAINIQGERKILQRRPNIIQSFVNPFDSSLPLTHSSASVSMDAARTFHHINAAKTYHYINATEEMAAAQRSALMDNFGIAFDFNLFNSQPHSAVTKNLVHLRLSSLSSRETFILSRATHHFASLTSMHVLRSSSRVGFHRPLIPPQLEELVWEAGPLLEMMHESSSSASMRFDHPEGLASGVVSRNLKRLVARLEHLSGEDALLKLYTHFPSLEHVSLLPFALSIFVDIDYEKCMPTEHECVNTGASADNASLLRYMTSFQRLYASHSKSDFLSKKSSSSVENVDAMIDFSCADPSHISAALVFSGEHWGDSSSKLAADGRIGLDSIARYMSSLHPSGTLEFASFSVSNELSKWKIPEGVHTIDLSTPFKGLSDTGLQSLPSRSYVCYHVGSMENVIGIQEEMKLPLGGLSLPSTLTHLSLHAPNGIVPSLWDSLPSFLRALHVLGTSMSDLFEGHIIKWRDLPQTLEDLFIPGLAILTGKGVLKVSHRIPKRLWRIVVGLAFDKPAIKFEKAPQTLLLFQVGVTPLITRINSTSSPST